ncbi:MAG: succinyldiaminopimelate transaminase [Alteromonadaceae bacterium]|nr:MAG: succinyldiaminopimelate transaminase [Alteromonadaceae bacterium]
MNPDLRKLHAYPFERLSVLTEGVVSLSDLKPIPLYIGEPKHQVPAFVVDHLKSNLLKVAMYPSTRGLDELRESIAQWANKRFTLGACELKPDRHILPVNGTREALFAFTQAVFDRTLPGKKILLPNPFYQIYEGAALLAGAELVFINCEAERGYLPDFDSVDDQTWDECQLLMLCTPGNPTGAVLPVAQMQKLIALADKHDFVIASDECYSELYQDEDNPPAGLLQACSKMGRADFNRCIVFNSLSKRSNLPGLRSGFVAGDADIIASFLLYRTYHGSAMPVHSQLASAAAWKDEQHVQANRAMYREKFAAVIDILQGSLDVEQPPASFFLWAKTPQSDTAFTLALHQQENVKVLPGSYLARDTANGNPGAERVRIALVASLDECIDAATRLRRFVESLKW